MHYILFSGHMVDAKDRKVSRFPAHKEAIVRAAIRNYLQKEASIFMSSLMGIAGGAAGADIIFHELCDELGITSKMYLASEKEEFKQNSVSFAGRNWERRFDQLYRTHPVKVIQSSVGVGSDIWALNNQLMLQAALDSGPANMTLIALWDGKGGDGSGGTEHMVKIAQEKSLNCIIIDITKL